MEEIISIITINFPIAYDLNTIESTRSIIMAQLTFPVFVCDVSLPQCNTGYVFILISTKYLTFKYIGGKVSVQEYRYITLV